MEQHIHLFLYRYYECVFLTMAHNYDFQIVSWLRGDVNSKTVKLFVWQFSAPCAAHQGTRFIDLSSQFRRQKSASGLKKEPGRRTSDGCDKLSASDTQSWKTRGCAHGKNSIGKINSSAGARFIGP